VSDSEYDSFGAFSMGLFTSKYLREVPEEGSGRGSPQSFIDGITGFLLLSVILILVASFILKKKLLEGVN
jgi:hypothetical protein